MQCSCGSETKTKYSTKTVKKVLIAYLEYEECPRCGRTGEVKQFKRRGGDFQMTARGNTGPHWGKM